MALRLKVVSFNIRYASAAADTGELSWAARKGAAVAALEAADADVLGLQEAERRQYDDLLWLLNERAACERYVGIFVGREADGSGEATAILFRKDSFYCVHTSTFWLSATPETPGSRSWGNPIPRICTEATFTDTRPDSATRGAQFAVFNTHLDYESREARRRGLALIVSRLPTDVPVVLTGDFNAPPGEEATLKLPRRVLIDTAEHYKAAASLATYHAYSGSTAHASAHRIDYIFASPGVVIDSVVVDTGRYPSHPTAPAAAAGAAAGGAAASASPSSSSPATASPRKGDARGLLLPSDHFPVVATLRLPVAADTVTPVAADETGGAAAAPAGAAATAATA